MIELSNLSFSYNREKLFSQLNLSLRPGNICGLLGKNGAGKTTLLKLLAGLLFPQKGETRIMGQHPGDRSLAYLEELSFLPEEFSLPSVSPRKYEQLYAPFYPRFKSELFSNYLAEFELDPNQNLDKCSFGQKKKFLLAFGFSTDCRLTLLDEPTNSLDIPSKRQFRKTLASVLTDDRLIVISTHQARDLENLIDPVVILDEGRIIFNHSLEEISDRLCVRHLANPPTGGEVFYSEKTMDGYLVVAENIEQEETKLDLELLFN
ncbi:MAG: ABC transporter ATP-binding protein, partial [Desulfobacterales bacterium]|nr:ABC transporter ATP-binding protein [Desulfobacterales bacterium]